MPDDNFASGVTALVLIAIIIVGFATFLFRRLSDQGVGVESKTGSMDDVDYGSEGFSRPLGAVESWPQQPKVTRGTGELHPFRNTPPTK